MSNSYTLMKNSPAIASFYSNPNLIGVTPLQSVEFNGVLTSISECVFVHQLEQSLPLFLQQSQQTSQQPSQNHHLQHNWQLLLQHLTRVVLPEIYVFFHDTSCRSEQRHVIHQKIDKVLRQFRKWTKYSPMQLQMISQNNLYQGNTVDNYLVGTGQYGSMACNLLPLMMLSNVNGNLYLKDIAPLISLLLDNDRLQQFLLQDSLAMIEQLDDWTDKRLLNFSQPTSEELANHSQILCEKQHPLIKHVQQDFQVLVSSNELELITTDNNLSDKKNVLLNILAVIKNVLSFLKKKFWDIKNENISIFQKLLIIALFFFGCLYLSARVSPIFPFLFSFGAIAMVFIVEFFTSINQPENIENNSNQQIEEEIKEVKNDRDNLFPIILEHKDSNRLKQLFSNDTFLSLRTLISVVNDTHGYLDYLHEHHPYLANSVNELLMDIAINTILRLNQQAENFFQQGKLDYTAKKIFANKHEENVYKILTNHINEVTALKESIIAKQMAGFAGFGSEQERQFRDSVMELKILLNWFVAQEDDEAVSKYGFIKEKIESEMLVNMETIYYQADTTSEQKDELYKQVQELLSYFKSQSPQSAHGQLQLTSQFTTIDTSHLLGQSETQQFIDFNKYYLKELQKHW